MTNIPFPELVIKFSKFEIINKIIDQIWWWAGDKSLDHNFYTKRALLAGVYTSAFLTFLEDDSLELIKTQAKLDLRLSQVGQIPQLKAKIKSLLGLRS